MRFVCIKMLASLLEIKSFLIKAEPDLRFGQLNWILKVENMDLNEEKDREMFLKPNQN